MDVEPRAQARHVGFLDAGERGQPGIGEALRLQPPERPGGGGQAQPPHLRFRIHNLLQLPEKPRVDGADGVDLLDRYAEAHGLGTGEQPVGRRAPEGGADGVLVVALAEALDEHFVEAVEPDLQTAQRLLQALGEGAPDRHHLADRFHRCGQQRFGAGELLEGEARHLGDDIVDGRLEARRCGAAGDVVVELVERVAHRQLGGDLGDGKAGRLRGQRRGARHARVHLDDDQPPVGRVDRELDVGAAGLDADLAQDADRGVAHDLEFLVGQRQRRGDGDRIAGVDAHRIDVLDRADDDAVIRLVADDLHLELFPAEHRFLDQHLGGRRGVETALDDVEELLAVEGDAAAGAAEREGGADDRRQADRLQRVERLDQALLLIALAPLGFTGRPVLLEGLGEPLSLRLRQVARGDPVALCLMLLLVLVLEGRSVGENRARRLQADAPHRLAEQLAVLGHVDGFRGGTDHLDAEFLQHAHLAQRQRGVQRRLAAHGGQQHQLVVRPGGVLLLDDFGHDLRRDRLDIGGVGQLRVGHDGGRVGVDQHHPVALVLQRLHGLGAGIVELAGLADDDRAGADDEDRVDVGAFRHGGSVREQNPGAAAAPGRIPRCFRLGGAYTANRGGAEPPANAPGALRRAAQCGPRRALGQRRDGLAPISEKLLPGLVAAPTARTSPSPALIAG